MLCKGQTIIPDLKTLPKGKGWKGDLEAIKVGNKGSETAVEFNKSGQNVVWLDGFDFKEGIIEFDAKGKSAPHKAALSG